MKLSNGEEVVPVEGAREQELKDLFKAYTRGLVRVGRSKCVMPQPYVRWAQQYLDYEFRSSDVVVATYPKCGTTWTQEIIWTMMKNPDLDNPEADLNLAIRSPFMEFDGLTATLVELNGHNPDMVAAVARLAPDASPDDGIFLKLAEVVPDRRVLKTHLPLSLLPANMLDTCKVVYVARNPKDDVCSYLHHHRLIKVHDFQGTDEQFVDCYCRGDLLYGSYADNLAEAWQQKDHKNMLILFYEDLQKDMAGELSKINIFLGLNRTEKQLQNVAQRTTFKEMKSRMDKRLTESKDDKKEEVPNDAGHGVTGMFDADINKKAGFYRKGESGAWRVDLAPSLAKKVDKWTEENITSRLGITFSYGD